MCEGKGLDHIGDKQALVARLVAFEEAKATEPEPEVEPPASEPEPEPPASEPETSESED